MFKRILILFIILSPLLVLGIGYPIRPTEQEEIAQFSSSMRCFRVGNMTELFSCFQTHPRLSGVALISQIISHVNALQPTFGILILLIVAAQIIMLVVILPLISHDDTN